MSEPKIKIGLVGVRGFGEQIATAILKSPNLQLSACYHPDKSKAEEYAMKYNCRVFSDFDEFLLSPEIQAVALVTPNHLHFEQIKSCIKHKKHIFVEKPITNKLDEAKEVIKECENNNLILMVGHNMRRNDAIRKIKKLMEEGKIGNFVSAEINMSHAGGMKQTPKTWRYYKDKCPGGSLMMLGIHAAEISNYLFGPVKKVASIVKNQYAPTESEDTSAMLLESEAGGCVYIANNYNHPGTHFVRVYGTKGVLEYNRNRKELTFQGLDVGRQTAELEDIPFEKNDMLLEEMKEFGQCILDNKTPETGCKEAFNALSVVESALKANKENKFIEVEKSSISNAEKTIFIVISEGRPARDILRTEVFATLQKQKDLRIIIFLPGDTPSYWREEFNYPNVVFEKMDRKNFSVFRRKIFDPIFITLLHAESAYLNMRFGTRKKIASPSRFVFWLFWSKLFGNSVLMKRFFRFIEMKLYPDKQYTKFFDKYNPNLVFTTSILAKVEIPMLKEAKRRGIKTVSIPKSWDTFDKRLFRIKPDRLIVQNKDLKDLAIKGQDVKEERITVVGFPQFDVYSDKSILKPREEFLKSLGLDPAKKVVFFGSGGLFGPSFLDEEYADILCEFTNSPECVMPCSLIIRLHFAETNSSRFEKYKKYPNVYIDNTHQRNKIFGELGDPSVHDMIWLANLLYHSDVTINPGSTLSLDASCYDKPSICTAFGCRIMENCLKIAYFKRALDTGGIKFVTSPDELKQSTNQYLLYPDTDKNGRDRLRKNICAQPDGQVGKRIADFLLNELNFQTHE